MTTAQFAATSDNAVMFASIVYVLAFVAHLTEWVLVRSLPVESPKVPVAAGASSAELSGDSGAHSDADRLTTRRNRSFGSRSGGASASR